MPDSDHRFDEIFKRLTREEFMEDPARILPLMMDFGFDSRQVKLLRMVMVEDMKKVKDFLQSPIGSGYEIVRSIADYCLVSEEALKEILDGIRASLDEGVETEIIDDYKFGRCRITADGIAKYSLDMTVLLRVKEDISEFTIPRSVTEIGEGAFFCCESLVEVHIPDSVTEIGKSVFSYCESLEEVHIPDSVTEIGEGAFFCCESLVEVHIPDSVTEIGGCAFSGCESLTEVHIPDSVTEIGDYAFSECTSVHFIVDEENEFYCSESGALFDKDKEVLIVGYPLVQDGVCDIPDSVTEIREDAFSWCNSLTEVHIPDSVTEIGEYAFSHCESLEEVHIPDSVTEIGGWAFFGCTSLTIATVPDSVDIEDSGLYDCDSAYIVVYPAGCRYSKSGKIIEFHSRDG